MSDAQSEFTRDAGDTRAGFFRKAGLGGAALIGGGALLGGPGWPLRGTPTRSPTSTSSTTR